MVFGKAMIMVEIEVKEICHWGNWGLAFHGSFVGWSTKMGDFASTVADGWWMALGK
jgi:hypothetical protein